MDRRLTTARSTPWLVAGLVLAMAATPLTTMAVERIVLCEEFTGTW